MTSGKYILQPLGKALKMFQKKHNSYAREEEKMES